MAQVKDIYEFIDALAPFRLQMDFDNAGFLVGREHAQVFHVLVALDITDAVIDEAIRSGAQLIVAHHPVIFHPVRSITDQSVTGQKLLRLAERSIAAICAHTNLDAAQDGVNDCLARGLGLKEICQLHQDGVDEQGRAYGIGRIGTLEEPMQVARFAEFVKNSLRCPGIRYVDSGRPVYRVAVGGGSCGSMLEEVFRTGCDTFVTADVKYDVFLDARERGINLLDAGHFSTEDVVCQPLVEALRHRFPELTVTKSACLKEVFSCL